MRRVPAVVSVGLCSVSGLGAESAWRLALSDNPSLFPLSSLGIFRSPRNGNRLVAKASGASARGGTKIPACGKILLSAVSDAVGKVDLCGFDSRKMGLWLGTSIGGIFETENSLEKKFPEFDEKSSAKALRFYECSSLAELAARRIGIRGECAAYSTACSSSGIALAEACTALELGEVDVAFACGVDSLSDASPKEV